MIQLNVNESKKGFYSFNIKGHALNSNKGSNIVCAGVSAISQSIIMALRDLLGLDIIFEFSYGYLNCVLPKKILDEDQYLVNLLILTLINGIKDLQIQFPNEIKIQYFKINN